MQFIVITKIIAQFIAVYSINRDISSFYCIAAKTYSKQGEETPMFIIYIHELFNEPNARNIFISCDGKTGFLSGETG